MKTSWKYVVTENIQKLLKSYSYNNETKNMCNVVLNHILKFS